MMSLVVPGPNGTTIVIGLLGKSCAPDGHCSAPRCDADYRCYDDGTSRPFRGLHERSPFIASMREL
jgi:hypothetical protein